MKNNNSSHRQYYKRSLKDNRQPRKPADNDIDSTKWQTCSRLFPPIPEEAFRHLERLPQILQKVRPLKHGHLLSLPEDIRHLSKQLTSGRAGLHMPYWSNPASVSAYLHYFFPWNIIRLLRLFTGLNLSSPPDSQTTSLIDAGSGPLTLPIALWLARPDLRKMPIHIIANDSSHQALELGKKIFFELACKTPWRITLINSPLDRLTDEERKIQGEAEKPWLISCANALNELASRRSTKHRGDQISSEKDDSSKENLFERILSAWTPIWQEISSPSLLFVEPGTRLGGNALMNMRKYALEAGMSAFAPCTHDEPCPLLNSERRGGSLTSQWCHFSFLAGRVPEWLKNLSEDAGLNKQSLSLSMLLLQNKSTSQKLPDLAVRVISRPFQAQGIYGDARYGCAGIGLALLENARNLPSGALTIAKRPNANKKDAKHGIPVLDP